MEEGEEEDGGQEDRDAHIGDEPERARDDRRNANSHHLCEESLQNGPDQFSNGARRVDHLDKLLS